jgi:hypothetical protein
MRAPVSAEARARYNGARRTRGRWAEGTAASRFSDMYPGTIQVKAGEGAGKTFQRGCKSASFFVW